MAVTRRILVSLDCDEPAPLATFWAAMLGGEVRFTTAGAIGVCADGFWICAIQIPDHRPPTWPGSEIPKQMHLDLGVEDLAEAVAEAERLGARPVPDQPAPEQRRILLDPAGHPFCLTTQVPREAR